MEQCFICRKWIAPWDVCRRVLPVSQSQGFTLGALPGVSFFVHKAPVSVCPACDAVLAAQRPSLGQWGMTIVVGLVLAATLQWLLAAIIGGMTLAWRAGHWKVAVFLSGLILWRGARLIQRLGRSRVGDTPIPEPMNFSSQEEK